MKRLGIDIGGSGIKGAIVDITKGEFVTARKRIDTPRPVTPQAVADTVKQLVQHFNWTGHIGCGFPAALRNGTALTTVNIDQTFLGTNVEQLLEKATNCKVKVINDADAAGLAEMRYGAGRHQQQGVILMVTLGTGIGTAVFNNGLLLPNTEFGQLLFKGDIGEKYAANSVRKTQAMPMDVWAKRVNEFLCYIERLLYPKLIIVGGGISKRFDSFAPYLTNDTQTVPAQLRNHAGIIGSAYMVQ